MSTLLGEEESVSVWYDLQRIVAEPHVVDALPLPVAVRKDSPDTSKEVASRFWPGNLEES